MLVLTRKNRESVVIGRPEDLEIVLEITILEIEGGRVRLGFTADTKMPIHRREVWDRICNGAGHAGGNGNGNGHATGNGHGTGNGHSAGAASVAVSGRTFAVRATSVRIDGGPA
jgi:carbon storage regulator CsrA